MDLTNLDRVSLARLTGHLQTIATAADALAEGGLDPEISLTAEATLLRAAPILSHGAEPPEPVLVDPEDAVVIVPAGPIMGGGGGGCGPAVPDVAPDAFPEFVSPPAAAADDAPAAEDCEASAAGVEDLPPHPPGVPAAAAGEIARWPDPRPADRAGARRYPAPQRGRRKQCRDRHRPAPPGAVDRAVPGGTGAKGQAEGPAAPDQRGGAGGGCPGDRRPCRGG